MFTFTILAQAVEKKEKYSSVARNEKGQTAYQEQHEVLFNDGQVQKATTQYLNPNGQVIGELHSDFTKFVTIPDYEYKDLRNNSSHGIKTDSEKITLWKKSKDGKLEESHFSKNQFPEESLIVGCQGLHYYLIDNLERVKDKKSIFIKYFMPGKLDYYSFTLRLDRKDEKYIYIKLSIDSFFLKIFTSSLDLKYNKTDWRLIQYSGLSNITNDKDDLQNVVIDYKYD